MGYAIMEIDIDRHSKALLTIHQHVCKIWCCGLDKVENQLMLCLMGGSGRKVMAMDQCYVAKLGASLLPFPLFSILFAKHDIESRVSL